MSNDKLHWDCIQFEQEMEKEISYRKNLGSLQTTKRFSEVRIADQFFIFGIPPNSKKDTQKTILVAYPAFEQPNIPIGNILQLSNPFSDVQNPTKSKFSFSLIEKNSPSTENGIIDEFVFQYNARTTKMYGICACVQPSKSNKSASLPFYATENTKKSQFCFVMMSKIPIFNVHITFLHYIVGLSCGSLPPIKIKSTTSFSFDNSSQQSNDTVFEGLTLNGHFGQYGQIEVPEEIKSILIDHFSKTLFSSPVKLAPSLIIHFPPPTTPIPRLILYASLDTVFSVLSNSDIVEILTALILDAQVIIIGSTMQEVSMTVFGLFALIQPFNYCGVVMPILPNNEDYLNLLNSPTPYIFGMPNIPKIRKMQFLESTVIVNLDKRKKTASNFFPKYPNFKDVVKKLGDLLASEKVKNSEEEKNHPDNIKPEIPKQTRIKPSFTSPPRKLPQISLNDDDADDDPKSKETNDAKGPARRRHYTVNKSDFDQTGNKSKGSDNEKVTTAQIHEFPSFDKRPSIPELLNDNNPYKFPLEFKKKLNHKVVLSMETMDKILGVLHEPLDFIFSDTLNGYFVTNAQEKITIFNQSLFLASVKPEDLNFYEFLLESQTFQDYVETKLDEFTKSKSIDPSERRPSSFGQKSRKRAATVRRVIAFD